MNDSCQRVSQKNNLYSFDLRSSLAGYRPLFAMLIERTPDKLNLRINGSIDLGSSWNVRDSINKIGQSLRQDNRDKTKVESQNTRDVQYNNEVMSDNLKRPNKWYKWDITGHSKESRWESSGEPLEIKDLKDGLDSQETNPQKRETISDNRGTIQSDNQSENRGEVYKRDHVHWVNMDNFPRRGDETSDISDNREVDIVPRNKERRDVGIVGYTQFGRMKTTDHKAKDDERINEISVHLLKQKMQVFDSIKRKMSDNDTKAKVDDMARSYKDQFGEFVRKQRETSVRTQMGVQRAILHTMDTSNLILQRLVNFLKADTEQSNIGPSMNKILQREVDAARYLEYKHVCSKYGYCRTDKSFTTMLQNCIKTILSVDDEKMYQARDAITEVLKTADYSKLIDSRTDKYFQKKIKRLEKREPEAIREALRVLLAMLNNAQTPLETERENSEVVKKTVAFYSLLAMWEDVMPGDEANRLEWADVEKSLGEWANGTRTDIFEIVKALQRNMERGFKKIDPDTAVKMNEQVKIISG